MWSVRSMGYLQDTLTWTSAIAGGKTRSNVTHGMGTERRFKNRNGNHGAQNITKKLHSWPSRA